MAQAKLHKAGSTMQRKRVIVLNIAGLSPAHCASGENMPNVSALKQRGRLHTMRPVFPALTLPVQASMTTGRYPAGHGIVANGSYARQTHQVSFWEQAAALVEGERVWTRIKRQRPDLQTALLFMQHSLYADAEVVVTPKPFHTEQGFIPWCYSKPVGFYEELCERLGPFNLMHYWGPMASIEASRWIAGAAVETISRLGPDLMFVYLPHLDYCLQKLGPDDPGVAAELQAVDEQVGRIVGAVEASGLRDETVFVVTSEYCIQAVSGDVSINRVLRNNGLLRVRMINGREYLDCELSRAFAMVDHQVAHLYVKGEAMAEVRGLLSQTEGIDFVFAPHEKTEFHIDHPAAGDLVAVSARDRWFSYYWWNERRHEPDFATQVDIHRKPGYDPLELFLEPGTRSISQDTRLIKGSHGYPALAETDRVPLLISGVGAGDIAVPAGADHTILAALLEGILL